MRAGASIEWNQATRIVWLAGVELAPRPLDARESFLLVYERARALARSTRSAALVVAAVDGAGAVCDVLALPERAALSVGRHTQCDLRLSDDVVSLRHLALLVRPREGGGAPVVYLWDLNTRHPFTIEDLGPSAAAIVD